MTVTAKGQVTLLNDDPKQAAAASKTLNNASTIAVTLTALCEVVWVLSKGYKLAASDIADAIELFLNCINIEVNRGGVDVGLGLLRAGDSFIILTGVTTADGIAATDFVD